MINSDTPLPSGSQPLPLRTDVRPEDLTAVRRLVQSTGVFHDFEVRIAAELVEERLRRGDPSGYHFLFSDDDSGLAGYSCWGPIACTQGSFDIFWIAVAPQRQGQGLGRQLMHATESHICKAGGRRIYLETSGRPDYLPTRRFYHRCGYQVVATLPDFYADGDDKIILMKPACLKLMPTEN
ncbi:MAG: GNAT family N-acetyltransferase [Planctomycetota bacterium]